MKINNLIYRLMSIVAIFVTIPLTSIICNAEDVDVDLRAQKRADAIKENKRYYSGIGYGRTSEEADRFAVEDLCKNISMKVGASAISVETESSEKYTSTAFMSTFVSLSNPERLDISSKEGKWIVFRYIEREQVMSDMAIRDDRIRTLIEQGKTVEKRLEIGSALKYFNWAYTLSQTSIKPVDILEDGKSIHADIWLENHINAIFGNIDVGLTEIYEDDDPLDPISIALNFSYGSQPISDLDLSYNNNGNKISGQHVKNGKLLLQFESLPKENIEIDIYHTYQDEGSQYDPELQSIYNSRSAVVFPKSKILIPCKGKSVEKFSVEKKKKTEKTELAPALVTNEVKRVDTEMLDDISATRLIDVLQGIWKSIDTKNYVSVKDYFTPEGYSLFLRMMQSGKIHQATKTPTLMVEKAGSYLIGKSLPVTIVYKGGHKVREDIVCRFNGELMIESVAYALSKRAEDDIFRQNQWDMSARYAILYFMEDYQTAYALKRLDFIDKIFSDDALIIRGKKVNKISKTENLFHITDYTYTTEQKDEYLETLRRQFREKDYIKLTFEDNEIREQSGIYKNIFWIELKQFYSSSNYNDDGYLTLMIDMREPDPVIKIRTWAPGKMPLQELMQRFTNE